MGSHEFLLGTLRKKGYNKEVQGVVAAVLDSRVRVPNPVGTETVFRMVGRCDKVFELCNMGMIPQVWLAVDSDGKEHIFDKPVTRFDPSKKDGVRRSHILHRIKISSSYMGGERCQGTFDVSTYRTPGRDY